MYVYFWGEHERLSFTQTDIVSASLPSLQIWRCDKRSRGNLLLSKADFRRCKIPQRLHRCCDPDSSCFYPCVDSVESDLDICYCPSLCASLLDPVVTLHQNQSQRHSSGVCSVSVLSVSKSSLLMFPTDIVLYWQRSLEMCRRTDLSGRLQVQGNLTILGCV